MSSDDETLAKRFFDTFPRVTRFVRREAFPADQAELTISQIRVLAHVSQGVSGNSELAQALAVSVPCMSRMVDGLVEKGLLLRMRDSSDRRFFKLVLSKKGELLHDRIRQRMYATFDSRAEALSVKERAALAEGLRILRKLVSSRRDHLPGLTTWSNASSKNSTNTSGASSRVPSEKAK